MEERREGPGLEEQYLPARLKGLAGSEGFRWTLLRETGLAEMDASE